MDRWVLPDRREFSSFVSKTIWKKHVEQTRPKNSVLLPHQRFIATYLHPTSPYRGLLLYHGLGTGKTCASIAVAQAFLQTNKKVIVLAPASLKKNFEQEVIKCGGEEFTTLRLWNVARGGGVVPSEEGDADAGVPFADLSDEQKSSAEEWLRDLVKSRYTIVGYNGLQKSGLDKLTQGGTVNPFYNSLVIVDEVHNLTRTLANAKTTNTVKFTLYNLLMDAKRCKVVVLSGSPAINNPFEFAFMVNLLRGRLTEHKFSWKRVLLGSEVADVKKVFENSSRVDRSTVTASGATVYMCPEGFEFTDKLRGVVRGVLGDNVQYVSRILSRYMTPRSPVAAERYDPLPTNRQEFQKLFVDSVTGDLIRKSVLSRRMRGIISFYDIRDKALYPETTEIVEKVEITATQYTEYIKQRVKERQLEDKVAKEGAESKTQSVHKTYSRPVLNFVFPVADGIRKWRQDEVRADMQDDSGEGARDKHAEDAEYQRRLMSAVKKLMESDVWTDDKKLAQHSPKFSLIFERLTASVGKNMIYSTFRTLEGAGLMMALLNARGWQYVDVQKQAGGKFKLVVEGTPSGDGPPKRYIRPVPSSEEGALLLKIFNGQVDAIAEPFRSEIVRTLGDTNTYGEAINTVLLTASGAEGLSLSCVREVHIMEPHWNNARMRQVKGRAVRLRSHMDLPVNDRTVKTITYVGTFSDAQRKNKDFVRTQERDKGLTSDEELFDLALKKDAQIEQLMQLVRDTAVDCSVHSAGHASTGIRQECYLPPSNFKKDQMMPPNVYADKEDPVKVTRARVISVPNKRGKATEVIVIEGSTDVYDAAKWRSGKRVVVATVIDDGKKLAWL